MAQLLLDSLPFLAPALLPALLLLTFGSLGRRGRTVCAMLLALPAMGLLGDVLLFDHSLTHTLEVPNVFGRGPEGKPYVWILDEVNAPAWQWHVTAAAFLAAAALLIFGRRNRPAATPQPVLAAVAVSIYYLALRLALEKTATPVGIVWAVGASPASLVILPMFAWHCGRRAYGFKRFVVNLLAMLVLQRLVIVAFSYFATTKSWGTHLDVHRITDLALPAMSERVLTSPVQAWTWTILVPQMTLLLVFGLVFGIVLGTLPWWLARRCARSK
ncbi:MAG: hypothetical protein ABIP94_13540 [Planctomycetota bacterium]